MEDSILRNDPNEVYDLVELLGEGSYGAVYKAVDKQTSREVAVKILPADEDLNTLKREIEFLKQLTCDYVVGYLGCYLFEEELWIVMEYCAGGSVSDLFDATQIKLTEDSIRAIMAYTVLGLNHLHSNRSIHRDVKAGNILLTRDGKAKLADFGVSAQLTNTMNKRKTVIGTPFWMAPEVIQETSYDGRADVWSMGITGIEISEGQPPYYNVHPMRAIFMIPMKPPPTLKEPSKWSPEFVDFIRVCLVKNPEERATSTSLLTHAFVAEEVNRIRTTGEGSQHICNLVANNWEALQKFRIGEAADKKSGESDGADDADATMKISKAPKGKTANSPVPVPAPATIPEPPTPDAEPDMKASEEPRDNGDAAYGTMVRVPHTGGDAAEKVDDNTLQDTGTLRLGEPKSTLRRSSQTQRLVGTMVRKGSIRLQTQGSRPTETSDLRAALKYFRKAPSQRSPAGGMSPASAAPADDDSDLTGSEVNVSDMEHLSVQELKLQLVALDMQYQADMDELSRSYSARKQILETALARLNGSIL